MIHKGDDSGGGIPAGVGKNGLIGDLDLYLFERVCKHIRRWLEVYGKKIRISVNLSSDMFNYRYFFKYYEEVYEKFPCPKDCIEFELLESIVLNQVDQVQNVVEQLRRFGFPVPWTISAADTPPSVCSPIPSWKR